MQGACSNTFLARYGKLVGHADTLSCDMVPVERLASFVECLKDLPGGCLVLLACCDQV